MYERVKGIYLIERTTGPDDGPRFYVGQASDLFARLNQHSTLRFGDGQAIDRAIKELTPTAFRFHVLEIVAKHEDRDHREQHWIQQYIKVHGEGGLYNRQTGGKRGGKAIVTTSATREKILRAAVRGLFSEEIGYSVYLAAEHFGVGTDVVVDWRKSELTKRGLKFDSASRRMVVASTSVPVENWTGGILTQQQVDVYDEMSDVLATSELMEKMQITRADLRNFEEAYSTDYRVAEEVCKPSVAEIHVAAWLDKDQ